MLFNPGDEVIIPVPYWVTYKDVVNYTGAKCVFVDTDEANGFTLTASMIEPHLTDKTRMVIINSPSNPSGAVLDREEFEKIFALTSRRGIWLMTDECYCRFRVRRRAVLDCLYEGRERHRSGCRIAFEDIRDDRMAHRLRPRTRCRDGVYQQTAKPQHVEPDLDRAKGRGRGLRGPQESVGVMLAEYRRRRDFVIERLRQIPGVKITVPKGAFYAYPDISCALQKDGMRTPMQFAEQLAREGARCGCAGRGFRYRKAHPHLLRGVDGGAEARSRSYPQVHRRSMSVRLIEPRFVERVWGTTRLVAVVPRSGPENR